MMLFNEIKELAVLIVPWLVGGGGAALIINFLKSRLNIPDRPSFLGINARTWLSIGVSFVVGLIVVLAEGGFDPSNLEISNMAETISAIWVAAQTVYFKVLGGRKPS